MNVSVLDKPHVYHHTPPVEMMRPTTPSPECQSPCHVMSLAPGLLSALTAVTFNSEQHRLVDMSIA